jgi:hypothetical protein
MMPIRNIQSLTEEIELLDSLRFTLKQAHAKALLIAGTTDDSNLRAELRGYIGCALSSALDKADLIYYRARDLQREKDDETGREEVPLWEDLGRA